MDRTPSCSNDREFELVIVSRKPAFEEILNRGLPTRQESKKIYWKLSIYVTKWLDFVVEWTELTLRRAKMVHVRPVASIFPRKTLHFALKILDKHVFSWYNRVKMGQNYVNPPCGDALWLYGEVPKFFGHRMKWAVGGLLNNIYDTSSYYQMPIGTLEPVKTAFKRVHVPYAVRIETLYELLN